jgi:hypothetical protein
MSGRNTLRRTVRVVFVLLATTLMLPGAALATQAVAPEHNPPGDIPDNQVFIWYVSPAGYELQVPEGWSRKISGDTVTFADKYDTIGIALTSATQAPTVSSVKTGDVSQLLKNGHAITIKEVSVANLKAGPAIRVVYQSNSEPNAVTGKQTRLDHERFSYFHVGKIVTLDLAAPAGADNADQWRLISNSFRWK